MVIDTHVHILPEKLLHSEYIQAVISEEEAGRALSFWGKRIYPANPALTDQYPHLLRMEREGIDREVLSIPPYLFGYDKDVEFARGWSRAYNEALAEICREWPNRFIGLGTLPMQDIGAAAEELKYCMETLGFAGIELCSHVNGKDLDTEEFAPLFKLADHYQCAVLIHPFNVPAPPRMRDYYTLNLVGNPVETSLTAARMLLSCFFEKYPNVRVCFSHGGGAFPFIYSRIKNGYAVRKEPHSAGLTSIDLPDNMYFDSIVYEQSTFLFMQKAVGQNRVCLGSDYPFDMEMKNSAEKVNLWCRSKSARLMALEENPAEWLNL